jgi:non-specific serine/threonine protein kinase/serine/threonine-protein kinase
MGVVYLGERIIGGFKQQVAIKLIARHLRSSPAMQQFNLERDTLARLKHKNIARLLDAGITVEGTPYIVMEYIEGRPLSEICDSPALSLEDKLRLMLQLCEAVAYAHRNLVLHRDLKPGNVMVTGDGVVKLLDFGTLKLLGPAAILGSEMTQAGMRPMTRRYASPEHIRGETVSTASDVYSLGIILFRLLAGQSPAIPDAASAPQCLDLLEAVGLGPPGKTRPGQLRADKSALRKVKDLDAIVKKATRFAPDDRQSSVEEFAADIVNTLEDKPVIAHEGNLHYNLGKFYRRHRAMIFSIATILLVLAAGLLAVARQGRIAQAEALRAEAGVDDERRLTHFLLTDYIQHLQRIPGSVDAQHRAVNNAISYLDQLRRIAGTGKLRLDAIEAYRRMALLQGDPYEQNLGDPPGALASLEKAQVIAQEASAADPENSAVLSALAMLARTRSEVLFGIGRTSEAIVAMRTSIQFYDKIVANPNATPAQLQLASNAYNGLGDELGQPGSASLSDYSGALVAFRKDIELSQRALNKDPSFALGRQSIAIAHEKIGQILVRTDPSSAIEAYRLSLAERKLAPPADANSVRSRRSTAINYMDLGDALSAQRDYKAALLALDQARQIFESYALADKIDIRAQHDLAIGLSDEALVYVDMLNPDLYVSSPKVQEANARHAIDLLINSAGILERITKINPAPAWRVDLAYSQALLGRVEFGFHIDKAEGARTAASGMDALRQLTERKDASARDLSYITQGLLTVEPASLRNPALATKYAERLVTLDHRLTPDYLLLLSQAYAAERRESEARAAAREGLLLLPPPPPNGEPLSRTRRLLELEAK